MARFVAAVAAWLFVSDAAAATLHGRVTSPTGPVAGARISVVVVERAKPNIELSATASADGAFSFAIQAGEFVFVGVNAGPPVGVAMAGDNIFVPFRGDTEVWLRMRPFQRIQGTIRGGSGEMTVELHEMNSLAGGSTNASPAFVSERHRRQRQTAALRPATRSSGRGSADARTTTSAPGAARGQEVIA